jgi:hypothetical protein
MNLRKVEQLFFDKQRSEELVEKTNEALMTFVQELKRIKKVLFAAVAIDETEQKAESGDGRQSSQNSMTLSHSQGSMDLLLKKLMKFKHLEDDNKKLKNLLK